MNEMKRWIGDAEVVIDTVCVVRYSGLYRNTESWRFSGTVRVPSATVSIGESDMVIGALEWPFDVDGERIRGDSGAELGPRDSDAVDEMARRAVFLGASLLKEDAKDSVAVRRAAVIEEATCSAVDDDGEYIVRRRKSVDAGSPL